MHIPDGILSTRTLALTGTLSAVGLAIAARQVKRTLPQNKVPLLGLGAAFVFAAQMLNFPVAAGTSGHLLGGVLTAVLLGPGAAAIVIACVLLVQSLLFSDGGLLALGANVFNMAFVGGMGGYAIYRGVQKVLPGVRGLITAVFFASWCSTLLASLACAGELALSGTNPAGLIFPAMFGIHFLIGIGEGLITAMVVLAIVRSRPELLENNGTGDKRGAGWEFLSFGLVIALGMAIFVSPYACGWPDGLDKVAMHLGFEGRATTLINAWIPNYQMPGISSEGIATAIAGAAGTLVMFGLAWVVGHVLVRNNKTPSANQ